MTVRELIGKLLTDPNINFDQEIALGTKDGGLPQFGYILFHIKDINNVDDCVNVLWFEDPRYKKKLENEKWESHLELKDCPYCLNHDWVRYNRDKDIYKCRECGNIFSYFDINGTEKNKDKPIISKDTIDEVERYEKELENEHITPSSDDTM